MLPHEKALVERLQDKPFALLGINNDGPASELLPRLRKEGIVWRNAIEPDAQPLHARWNLSGWPNLLLLDAHGVIREHWTAKPDVLELDRKIDACVAEALRPR